jgi:hypothetical protein
MNLDTVCNPYRLVIFTNNPGDPPPPSNPSWTLSDMLVLKFYPGLNPDLLNPKLYALRFWKPAPPKQPELL